MKISLITVCFNSEKTIERTICSVLSQTFSDIEYIIVDGKSTDNTLQIISKYANKIAKVISEPDAGIYDAINKGIRNANGQIIGLLHADDVFAYKDALYDIHQMFELHNPEALYADLQYVNGEKIYRHWISGSFSATKFQFGWMPPHPTFYCTKKYYLDHQLYNTKFKIAADYELMLRYLYIQKCKVIYLPKVTVKMQIGGKSNVTLLNRIKANHEDKNAWIENNIQPYFFTFWMKPIRKLMQFITPYFIKK